MESGVDHKKSKTLLVEGINLLAQGKRNLLCGEVHQAVSQLEEASKIFAQEYGELAHECSDAYFSYGKALLELHRIESTVLGDAIKNEDEEEEEDDDEKKDDEEERESNKEDDKSSSSSETSEDLTDEECNNHENAATNNNSKENISANSNPDEGVKLEETAVHSNDNIIHNSVTILENNQASTSRTGPELQDEDDVSSLQLAWEVLELAKIIYSRQKSIEAKVKLSDTYFKLGDVGLESEQFADAIKDYECCLNLQREVFSQDNRCIAETLYQMGLAYTLKADYKPAFEFFNKTIEVLEMRINRLKKVANGELEASPEDAGDGFYTPIELADKEVKELEELVKEIYLKIDEIKDEECHAPEVSELMKESVTPTKHSMNFVPDETNCNNNNVELNLKFSDSEKNSTHIHNITHLIRKKKNTNDVSDESTKKIKLV